MSTLIRDGDWIEEGTTVRLFADVLDLDDGEPTGLTGTLLVEKPDDTVDSYPDTGWTETVVGGSPTRVSQLLSSPVDQKGQWSWRWDISGPALAAGAVEGSFFVRERTVTAP